MTAAAPARRRIGAQARMELRLLLRNGESLLVAFGIPVALLVFFSAVDVLPTGTDAPVEFLYPGVVALAVMSSAMVSLGIATGFERAHLVLKRLGATPLRRVELVTAKISAVLVLLLCQVAALSLVALLLGFRPGPGAPWGLVAVALLLGTAAFAGVGLAMAGSLRAVGTLALANGVYLALLLLGAVAIPLDRLPDVAATLARFLPAAPLAELLRAGVGTPTGTVVFDLVVLGCWAVVAPLVAARLFRWE